MSKGFVIFAQNTESINYIQQAYALALSIKLTQKIVNNVSLVTDDTVPENYKHVFDKIIPIPFGDQSNGSAYRAENRWKIYHATPYDETIVLDSDMLVLENIDIWWDYLHNYDVKFCNRIKNYKQEIVTDTVHRKAFVANHLSSPYYALHYFKKNEFAFEFYKLLEFVCKNWELCWTTFAPNEYQNWLSMDLATAVAIDLMGVRDEVLDVSNPMEFVHMKTHLQGWNITGNWQDAILYNFNKELTVGNILQHKIFHYVEKDFLTDQFVKNIEGALNGS